MVNTSLEGRVALVTGGGSGIGKASAIAFAEAGASVVVADIAAPGADETAHTITRAGGQATVVKADVTVARDVEAMVSHAVRLYGRLDCAHNNAGGVTDPARRLTHEYEEAIWRRDIDLNLHSVWLCMKHEIPQMLHQGQGCIVNTASIMGLVATTGATSYAAGKHAVVGLTRASALEYAQLGLRINAVCPGYVPTPSVREIIDTDPSLEERFTSKHPVGRMGTPEEIAAVVVWLCSDAASFVTGHAMPVDGGYTAQ